MSGGYGSGGYPGQGYDEDEDPGQRQRGGSGRRNQQGYDNSRQGGYHDPGYARDGYGDPGYDPQGYDPQGYDPQGTGGYPPQGTGPQPGQYGAGGMPQYGQSQYDRRRGVGPRRGQGQGGYDPRMSAGRRPRGYPDHDEESDSSFLPGFVGRDDYDNGRPGGYAPQRGGRPDGRGDRRPGDRGDRATAPRDQADPRGNRPEGRRPSGYDDWEDRTRGPRKKVTRWFPRILVLAVVAVIVIGGGIGGLTIYHKYQQRYHPADYAGPGTGDVTVQVPGGATALSLAPQLLKLGVIASERAFSNAAEAAPATTAAGQTGLRAGYFNLHHHMQASLAYAALLNPKNVVQATVTIPEGKRVSQVLSILAAHTKIPLTQWEAAAKQTSKLGLPSYAGTTAKLPSTVPYGQLEGYLFPATYAITPRETALQVLQAMVQRYDIEAQQLNIDQAARSVGLTPGKLIIEASMVQAEAGVNSDMPKMARVILNREARGMPDGFSSVDFYGLGKYGINLTNSAAAQASGPYDNSQQPGLPPTPVDNPGNVAIQAILHPASGPWLYFVTTAVGKPTMFSATCFQGTCG